MTGVQKCALPICWNNPGPVQVIPGREEAEHVIEIRMSEGSQDKTFSILVFAAGLEEEPETKDTAQGEK